MQSRKELSDRQRPKSEQDMYREMEELRESTMAALHESWGELEHLQQENQDHIERSNELQEQLDVAKAREAYWRDMVSQLQQKPTNTAPRSAEPGLTRSLSDASLRVLLEPKSGSSPSRSIGSVTSSPSSVRGQMSPIHEIAIPCSSSQKIETDMLRKPQETDATLVKKEASRDQQLWIKERRRIEDELLREMRELEQEKNEVISQWQVRVQLRDAVINDLKKEEQAQNETIKLLRKELDDVKQNGAKQEAKLQKEIEFVKRKLQEKRGVIERQSSKLEECQRSLAELAEELKNARQHRQEKKHFPASAKSD